MRASQSWSQVNDNFCLILQCVTTETLLCFHSIVWFFLNKRLILSSGIKYKINNQFVKFLLHCQQLHSGKVSTMCLPLTWFLYFLSRNRDLITLFSNVIHLYRYLLHVNLLWFQIFLLFHIFLLNQPAIWNRTFNLRLRCWTCFDSCRVYYGGHSNASIVRLLIYKIKSVNGKV